MNCAKALSLLLAVATTTVSLANTCEDSISVGVDASSWTVGTGQSNGHFTLLNFAGVEVGIRAMQRFVGYLTPTEITVDGDTIGDYRVETGPSRTSASDPTPDPTRSWWSFDFHVDVGNADDDTKRTIGDYSPLLLSVECVAGQCGTFGDSELASNGVYENLNLNLLGAVDTNSVYQESQNPGFDFWPWGSGIPANSPQYGGAWPPEDIPGDSSYDMDAEATYKFCLELGDTFCPVCMFVDMVPSQAPSFSGAPSGVPSKAPSLNPSGVPSISPSLSGKPSMVSCCRAIWKFTCTFLMSII